MKVGVIGSRDFSDYALMCKTLSNYKISSIVSGGARGADKLAARFAKENNIKLKEFIPDWTIGKHAGFLRNSEIVNESDIIIAFWDGKSNGTLDSIKKAKKQKKVVVVINYMTQNTTLEFD